MSMYVVMGATVRCSQGVGTSYLFPNSIDWIELCINNLPNISVNATAMPHNIVTPFRHCRITGQPCIESHKLKNEWKRGSPSTLVEGREVLIMDSFLLCKHGGMIRIINPGQVSTFWESLLMRNNLTDEHFIFLANLFLSPHFSNSQRERFLQLLTRPSVAGDALDPYFSPLRQNYDHPFFTVDRERAGAIYNAMLDILATSRQGPITTQLAALLGAFTMLGPYLTAPLGAGAPDFNLTSESGTLVLGFSALNQGRLASAPELSIRMLMPTPHSLVVNSPITTRRERDGLITQMMTMNRGSEAGVIANVLLFSPLPHYAAIPVGVVSGIHNLQELRQQDDRNQAFTHFINWCASYNATIVDVEKRDEWTHFGTQRDFIVLPTPDTPPGVDIAEARALAEAILG